MTTYPHGANPCTNISRVALLEIVPASWLPHPAGTPKGPVDRHTPAPIRLNAPTEPTGLARFADARVVDQVMWPCGCERRSRRRLATHGFLVEEHTPSRTRMVFSVNDLRPLRVVRQADPEGVKPLPLLPRSSAQFIENACEINGACGLVPRLDDGGHAAVLGWNPVD